MIFVDGWVIVVIVVVVVGVLTTDGAIYTGATSTTLPFPIVVVILTPLLFVVV